MALDGITTAALVYELRERLTGGKIDKLSQPEADEIIITIRSLGANYKLLLSANASGPRIHLTRLIKENPMTAPLFCMVLRKHLANGRIISVEQPDFERIVIITAEAPDEMGYPATKRLIIETMGKHSNIILTNNEWIILDSIKRISHEKSSVREVLPGLKYIFPPSKGKQNPLGSDKETFVKLLPEKEGVKVQNFLYQSYTGISPVMASEICHRAGIDASTDCSLFTEEDQARLSEVFSTLMECVSRENFAPEIYFDSKKKAVEFAALPLTHLSSLESRSYSSISALVEDFYKSRAAFYSGNQKTAELRKLVGQQIERCVRKKDIIAATEKEIENRETYRMYGELIRANMYLLNPGISSFTAHNYFGGGEEEITITLDAQKTPSENMQYYFKLYNKQKRTNIALLQQSVQNNAELAYLESVLVSLANCRLESDIEEIREELAAQGYAKRKNRRGKPKGTVSKPVKYRSSEGFEILAGKNNLQNDELTFKTAQSSDIWMHAKNIPGSHVLIRVNGREPGEKTLLEAAKIAAFHSRTKGETVTAVDYCLRKHVKKPSGSQPGFVIYETSKTIYTECDETEIEELLWTTQ